MCTPRSNNNMSFCLISVLNLENYYLKEEQNKHKEKNIGSINKNKQIES